MKAGVADPIPRSSFIGYLAGASFPSSCSSSDFSTTTNTAFTVYSSYNANIGTVSYPITSAFTVPIYTLNAKVTNLTNIYLGSNDECPTTTGITIITNSI
jgi:hypothetical protein